MRPNRFLLSRRGFLGALAATGVAAGAQSAAQPADKPVLAERPDKLQLQTGDLVWPKPAGAYIPYAGVSADRSVVSAEELGEARWQEMRVDFIRNARASAPALPEPDRSYQLRLAQVVEDLTYSAFINQYAADSTPEDYQTYGVGQLAYVGHVALIDVDPQTGTRHVVEAVYGKNLACESCVQRVTYDAWLQARGNVLVWHGRLRQLSPAQRGDVVAYARTQLQKPYRFFNFDLADAGGFYCSKLVWQAVKVATGIAVDGVDDPRRLVWLSPLQLMRAKAQVALMSSPGNYRNV